MPPRRSDEEVRELIVKMLVEESLLASKDDTDFNACNANLRQSHFVKNGLNGILYGRFQGSPMKAMRWCFPDYPWNDSLCSRKPNGYWRSIENVRAEVEKIRTARGWSIEECRQMSKDDYPQGLSDLYPSPIALLRAVYPDTQWEPWRMVWVPKGTWDNLENHTKVVKYLEKELGIETPTEWRDKLDGDTFRDFQGLVQRPPYNSSPTKLLCAVYPELATKLWLFKKTPKNFWNDTTAGEFLADFAEANRLTRPESWYSVTCDDIKAHGGAGLVFNYKSHIDLITKFVPVSDGFKWNRSRFHSTWATERIVGDYLEESHTILRGCEFRPDWLRNKTAPFEMDITLSDLHICVEVDGPGHFQTMWYGTHEGTFTRDVWKMEKAVKNGFSGIRLYQPDVYENRFEWKAWLTQAITFIREQTDPCWVFPDSPVYASHINTCREAGIVVLTSTGCIPN